jgi:hypothetical protein
LNRRSGTKNACTTSRDVPVKSTRVPVGTTSSGVPRLRTVMPWSG